MGVFDGDSPNWEPLTQFMMQLLLIVVLCRVLAYLFSYIKREYATTLNCLLFFRARISFVFVLIVFLQSPPLLLKLLLESCWVHQQ